MTFLAFSFSRPTLGSPLGNFFKITKTGRVITVPGDSITVERMERLEENIYKIYTSEEVYIFQVLPNSES